MRSDRGDEGNHPAAQPRTRPGVQERCFDFSLRVLRLVSVLPRSMSGEVVGRQVCRSGTAIGANVEEAQGAHSKKGFAQKMSFARKEAMETRYWLRLIAASEMVPHRRMQNLIGECDELVRILSAIVKSARGRGCA